MTLNFRMSQLAGFSVAAIFLGVQICEVARTLLATGSIAAFECSLGVMALAIAGSVFHRVWRNSAEIRLPPDDPA